MTFDQWLIVLAAIPPTVTAITALLVAIRTDKKEDKSNWDFMNPKEP